MGHYFARVPVFGTVLINLLDIDERAERHDVGDNFRTPPRPGAIHRDRSICYTGRSRRQLRRACLSTGPWLLMGSAALFRLPSSKTRTSLRLAGKKNGS